MTSEFDAEFEPQLPPGDVSLVHGPGPSLQPFTDVAPMPHPTFGLPSSAEPQTLKRFTLHHSNTRNPYPGGVPTRLGLRSFFWVKGLKTQIGRDATQVQTARAALNGSLHDLNKVVIGMSNLPDAQAILLLPVFHRTLQMLVIPTANQLDDPGVTAVTFPVRKTLRKICPHPRRGMSRALATHGEMVVVPANFSRTPPLVGRPSEELLCIDVALFAGNFVDDPDRDRRTTQLFASSPGFRFTIGKALLYVLKEDYSPFQTCLFILHFLTEYLDVGDRDNLEEFVDAAGGSFNQFAILLLDKINRIVSDSQPTGLSQNDITSFRFLLSMVVHIEMKTTCHARRVATMGPLVADFVPHGGARAFTALALCLARSKFASDFQAGTRFVLEECIMILLQLFTAPGGHMHLFEAVECDLLAAVVSAAKSPFADAVHSHISQRPFENDWGSSRCGGRRESVCVRVFTTVSLAACLWPVLRQLAKERLDVLKHYRTRESEYKACDNDEIHLKEIKFIHSRPETPYFIIFDYRLAFAQISVKAIAEADELELCPNGPHDVARAERSGVRIQLVGKSKIS
ncbi:hypothetical protein C8R47DRAFT_1198093 [Mycena vitilis]|nr:hypothetical protein C8R47DRAFT_1198093 [Mycena vitilis]